MFHFDWTVEIAPRRLPLALCLVAFCLTFLVTRTIVRYIRRRADSDAPPRWWQPRNIGHGAVHVHHMVVGVVLVLISGLTTVTLAVDGGARGFTVAALFFGIGAALVLDEFAPDPAPERRVPGRRRPDIGSCGIRRGCGVRPSDPRLQPAVILRYHHLAQPPGRVPPEHASAVRLAS